MKESASNMRECKLLLVDDSENDRLLFGIAARYAGIPGLRLLPPLSAGEEAIDYLRGAGAFQDRHAHPYPDLMVLDLKMPDKSGFDVLRWLQDQPRRPAIVVLSDSHTEQDVVKARALGADDYLQKPEGMPELVAMLRAMPLRGASICRAAEQP